MCLTRYSKKELVMNFVRSRIMAVATCLVFAYIPTALLAQEDAPDAAEMAKNKASQMG
jgi:hypothetical protein